MVWAWMLQDRMLLEPERNYGLGMDAAGPRMLLEHERTYGLGMDAAGPRMLLEHERNYGFGVHALVTACSSCNTNGIIKLGVDALGTRTELWFGHGCCRAPYALGTRTELWFGHGCFGDRMLLEHERNYGLGMDAAGSHALGTQTELWFGQLYTRPDVGSEG